MSEGQGPPLRVFENRNMEQGVGTTIIRNTAFNAIGCFWGILVALFLTPYILGHVGIERYGVWAIVGVITGYFGLLDLGIGTPFVKYISEYRARGDEDGLNRMMSTGVAFFCLLAALVVTLAFMPMSPLLDFFSVPAALRGEADFVLRLGMIIFAVSNVSSAYGAVQQGLQRMDVSNRISIGVSLPMIAGTVFALESGWGLRGLMVNNAAILALSGAANVVAAHRLLPSLRVRPFSPDGEMFRRLLGFGYKLQFSKAADIIAFQTDRLLLAHFLSIVSVGFYQLGSGITQQARQLPLLLVSAVLPAASDMDARREDEKLRELYLRGSKYLALASFPLFFLLVACAHFIMAAWVGPGYGGSALVVQLLACGYLANVLSGVGTSVAAAIGRPELQMRAALISAVSNIAFTLALVVPAGLPGVAAAVSVSLLLGPAWFIAKLHPALRLPGWCTLRDVAMVPLCASLAPLALLGAFNYFYSVPPGRPAALAALVLEAGAFMTLYGFIVMKSGWLNEDDRTLLRRLRGRPAAGAVGGAC